ncbi:hypothetical protein HK102_002718 [Quaeritorhiza haematococci]|nr:hypothetical protein HK102_002718 [Quaeritorhiza haematococci]
MADGRFFLFNQEQWLDQQRRAAHLKSSDLNITGFYEYQTMFRGAQKYHLQALNEIRAFLNHVKISAIIADPSSLRKICVKSDPELAKKLTALVRQEFEASGASEELYQSKSLSKILRASKPKNTSGESKVDGLFLTNPLVKEISSQDKTNIITDESFGPVDKLMPLPESNVRPVNTPRAILRNSRSGVRELGKDRTDDANLPKLSVKGTEDTPTTQILDPGLVSALDPHMDQPPQMNPAIQQILRWRKSLQDVGADTTPPPFSPVGQGGQLQTEEILEKRAGESEYSDASEKNLRLKLYKRRRMGLVLKQYIKRFSWYQWWMVVWFVGITALAFGLSVYMFSAANSNVDGFTTSIRMDREVVEVSSWVRYLNIYSMINDPDLFKNAAYNMNKVVKLLEAKALPYLKERLDRIESSFGPVVLVEPPLEVGVIKDMNAYELVTTMTGFSRDLLRENMTVFLNMEDPRIDFQLRNSATISDFLQEVASNGVEEYIATIRFGTAILGACLGVVVLTAIVWSAAIFYPTLKRTHEDQIRFMKVFALVPKKDLMYLTVDLEEAIEEINEEIAAAESENDQQHDMLAKTLVDQHEMKDKYSTYMRVYIAGVTVLALFVVGLLIIPLVFLDDAAHRVQSINYLGRRRAYVSDVNFFATEATIQQPQFWGVRDPEMQLDYHIRSMAKLHTAAVTGMGSNGAGAQSNIPELSSILTDYGYCHRTLVDGGCDPETRDPPYIPDIGYTKELVLEPLDTLVDRFLYESKLFLRGRLAISDDEAGKPNVTDFLLNPHLQIMRGIMYDIVQGLEKTEDILLQLISNTGMQAQQHITIIMVVTMLLTIVAYIFIFRRFASRRIDSANEIVNLVFMIPQTAVDAKGEIRRFIDTAGLTGLEDV